VAGVAVVVVFLVGPLVEVVSTAVVVEVVVLAVVVVEVVVLAVVVVEVVVTAQTSSGPQASQLVLMDDQRQP
jgi:hypothetical protein